MPVKRKGSFLFRIRVFKNRIAAEFSHILTDGSGALTFLKTLTAEYINLDSGPIDDWGDILKPGQKPDPEESGDSFLKYYNKNAPPPAKQSKAFHLPYNLLNPGEYHIITGIVPLDKLSGLAKEKKVTVNDILVALFIESFQEVYFRLYESNRKRAAGPIRIIVPINLRNLFPSKTLRNFILYITPEINPVLGKYSFDEILNQVYHYIRMMANAKSIQPDMARNVRGEKYIAVRLVPRFIKDIYLNYIHSKVGGKPSSGSLSNLGLAAMPDKIAEYIEGFDFIPGPDPETKCNCGVIGFKNNVFISFGRVIRETEIEMYFFRSLVKLGIPVKIMTN